LDFIVRALGAEAVTLALSVVEGSQHTGARPPELGPADFIVLGAGGLIDLPPLVLLAVVTYFLGDHGGCEECGHNTHGDEIHG